MCLFVINQFISNGVCSSSISVFTLFVWFLVLFSEYSDLISHYFVSIVSVVCVGICSKPEVYTVSRHRAWYDGECLELEEWNEGCQ